MLATGECERPWHREIPGVAFTIGDCIDEYGGIIGYDSLEGAFHHRRSGTLDQTISRLQTKHPQWSYAKIRTAAQEKQKNSPASHTRSAMLERGADTVILLKKLIGAFGPVGILVTDETFDPSKVLRSRIESPQDELTVDALARLKINQLLSRVRCPRFRAGARSAPGRPRGRRSFWPPAVPSRRKRANQ